jgi:tape measure domain-containing protein
MATIGRITANLGLNKRGFDTGLQSAGAGLAKFAGLAAAGFGAVFAGMKAFDALSFGVQLAAEAEAAEVGFATLLGSTEAAKKLLGDLSAFAASTPFEVAGLRDAAKKLLAFGVPAEEIIDRMTMLGDIAAGTGKPLGEFAAIFGKIKATGVAGLEQINQLAERGVPIYSALAKTMGVSESAIRGLAGSGKIGFEEIDAALKSTTAAGGMFAGGMLAQSQTVMGLWSTLKDSVSMVLLDIGRAMMDGFDFKGVLTQGITFADGVRAAMTPIGDLFKAIGGFVRALIPDFAASGATMASAFSGGIQVLTDGFLAAEFAVTNFGALWDIAVQSTALGLVTMGEDLKFLFTGTLPALLTWAGKQWSNIWFTMGDLALTILANLGENIRSFFSELWDFIASGGSDSFDMTWKPLTDGFVNAIESLPDLPERAMSDVEAALAGALDSMMTNIGGKFDDFVAGRRAEMAAGLATPETTTATPTSTEPPPGPGSDKPFKAADSLQAGSREAFQLLARAQAQGSGTKNLEKTANASLTTQKQIARDIATIANRPAAGLGPALTF